MSWSRLVRDPAEARAALADPGDALDLRAASGLDDTWAALGFAALGPGELACPLDVPLADLAATRALGARLAGSLRAGDLVVLSGSLGAGKTSMTQGLATGLGVRGPITSPTFVLARAHPGPVPLVHVDVYRLREAGWQAGSPALDLADLDLEAALDDGVVVVEWGEGLVEGLSDSRLHVRLSLGGHHTVNPDKGRIARVQAHGPRWSVVPLP